MRAYRTTLLALALLPRALAQTVSVAPSEIPGLTLIGPQSSDFQSGLTAIVGSPLPPEFAAYLPFTVVLKNGSAEPVVACHVCWAADPVPNRRSGGVDIGMESNYGTSEYLKPGASVAVLPFRDFAAPPSPDALAGMERHLRTAVSLQKAKNVVISIDSAIFASGLFAGPDTRGNFNRQLADFSAWRAVDSGVQSQLAQGTPFETIASQLQQLASQTVAPAATRDWNQAEQAQQAALLLRQYKKHGAQAVANLVNQQLQAPVINVHK